MSDIEVGDRVIVEAEGDYDLGRRAPAVVVEVDGDEATVVFEHTDAPTWRGISDEQFRHIVVDTLRRNYPEYFGRVPTYRYPTERLRETLWHGWQPRWAGDANGGESA